MLFSAGFFVMAPSSCRLKWIRTSNEPVGKALNSADGWLMKLYKDQTSARTVRPRSKAPQTADCRHSAATTQILPPQSFQKKHNSFDPPWKFPNGTSTFKS